MLNKTISEIEYINASPIQAEGQMYIATQAPLKATIEHFWKMVLEQRSPLLICLATREGESELSDKIESYWPEMDESLEFSTEDRVLTIKVEKEERVSSDVVKRELVICDGNLEFKTTHIQHLHWDDQSVPHFKSFLNFMKVVSQAKEEIRTTKEEGDEYPVVVHCKHGVGRTGTFIALDSVFTRIHTLRESDKNATVNFCRLLFELRMQRYGLLSTTAQYKSLYAMLHKLLNI